MSVVFDLITFFGMIIIIVCLSRYMKYIRTILRDYNDVNHAIFALQSEVHFLRNMVERLQKQRDKSVAKKEKDK